jgi:tight adherence protein C
MQVEALLVGGDTGVAALLWSPLTFGALLSLAVVFTWMAFAPARSRQAVLERLEGYLGPEETVRETTGPEGSFIARAILPAFRRLLGALGRLMPHRQLETTRRMLIHAGQPGGLSALDFYGLRLLMAIVLGGSALALSGGQPFGILLRNAALGAFLGYLAPLYWLRRRVRARKQRIARALPDALDMMTIGVEAGLAFESAMLKVGDLWDNELTREFRRAVAEMRVGTPRDEALERMVERTGVEELAAFVAILVQSTQLGVTIAEVLHTQAADMRVRRRQRAEELARQAGLKMLIPLLLFIFPALMVVVIGPSIPRIIQFFVEMRSGLGGVPLR